MPNSGPIGPKILEYEVYLKQLEQLLRREGKLNRDLLVRTVETWERKPDFESTVEESYPDLILVTYTANPRYNWIEAGTGPRLIQARNAPYLNIRYPYYSKTRVRKMSSRKGHYYGKQRRRKRAVTHSIEARHWYEEGEKRRQPVFARKVEKFMERMAKVIWV